MTCWRDRIGWQALCIDFDVLFIGKMKKNKNIILNTQKSGVWNKQCRMIIK